MAQQKPRCPRLLESDRTRWSAIKIDPRRSSTHSKLVVTVADVEPQRGADLARGECAVECDRKIFVDTALQRLSLSLIQHKASREPLAEQGQRCANFRDVVGFSS